MGTVARGIVAGFIATLALSILLDPIVFLTGTAWTAASGFGWPLHVLIGPVVWGAAFALVHDHMSGPSWLRGVVFATGVWLLVMVGVPAIGPDRAGFLGIGLNAATLAAALIMHALYGAVLGMVLGALATRDATSPPAAADRLHPVVR
jgi:hypothetical protein